MVRVDAVQEMGVTHAVHASKLANGGEVRCHVFNSELVLAHFSPPVTWSFPVSSPPLQIPLQVVSPSPPAFDRSPPFHLDPDGGVTGMHGADCERRCATYREVARDQVGS